MLGTTEQTKQSKVNHRNERLSVVKSKPKQSNWTITTAKRMHVAGDKHGKTRTNKSPLWFLVLLLIGYESGDILSNHTYILQNQSKLVIL